jgi:hypothetical protein
MKQVVLIIAENYLQSLIKVENQWIKLENYIFD